MSNPSDQPIIYQVDDGICTLTLNRPESLNAMNNGLMLALIGAMEKVNTDESVRLVIITGAGRGFCSGADLSQVAEGSQAEQAEPTAENAMDDVFNPAMRALTACPVPTLAKINGVAAGGGLGLALACDISIAATSAFFVATFGPNLGIVPDLGTTWNLPRRVGRSRALGMALLGDRISAEQAASWGLIWQVVADEDLDDAVQAAAATLKNSSPAASVRIRASIDAATDNSFSEQLDLEMHHQDVLIPKNMLEGARAFMEKRKPHFSADRS